MTDFLGRGLSCTEKGGQYIESAQGHQDEGSRMGVPWSRVQSIRDARDYYWDLVRDAWAETAAWVRAAALITGFVVFVLDKFVLWLREDGANVPLRGPIYNIAFALFLLASAVFLFNLFLAPWRRSRDQDMLLLHAMSQEQELRAQLKQKHDRESVRDDLAMLFARGDEILWQMKADALAPAPQVPYPVTTIRFQQWEQVVATYLNTISLADATLFLNQSGLPPPPPLRGDAPPYVHSAAEMLEYRLIRLRDVVARFQHD